MGEVPPVGPPPVQRYVWGGLVGRGGMGRVYVAQDLQLGREVALKELDPSFAENPRMVRRLAREAWITARLDHPGIIAVHDIGTLPDGRPFYTMRLVRGISLAEALVQTENRLTLLRSFLSVCEAVASAHQSGIVHRDLKPSNILLGGFGETQVIDWGLAVPTAAAQSRWSLLPPLEESPGTVVGTDQYMSPDQAKGEPPDPRDDVWSLGVILQEIIAGKENPELRAIRRRAQAAWELRYADAGEFAADLLRWLDGREVQAHSYSATELLVRFMKLWRLPLLVAVLGLLAVSVATGVGFLRTRAQRDRALSAEAATESARKDAINRLAQTWIEQSVFAAAQGDRPKAERRAVSALQIREDPLARGVLASFGRAARPVLRSSSPGQRCAWSLLLSGAYLCGQPRILELWSGKTRVWSQEIDTVGGRLRENGDVELWTRDDQSAFLDVDTGQIRRIPNRTTWMAVHAPRKEVIGDQYWSPGASFPCPTQLGVTAQRAGKIAAFCRDGTLQVDDHPPLHTPIRDDQEASQLRWLSNGTLLAGTLRGGLRLIDATTGVILQQAERDIGAVVSIEVAPGENLVAIGGSRGDIEIWSIKQGEWVAEVPASHPNSFRFVDDHTLVVQDGQLRRWELPRISAPTLLDLGAGLADVEVAADGERIGLATGNGWVKILNVESGAVLQQVAIGTAVVKSVIFVGDQIWAASTEKQGVVRVGGPPLPQSRILRRLVGLADHGVAGVDMIAGLCLWTPQDEAQRIRTDLSLSDLEAVDGGAVALADDGSVFFLENGALNLAFRADGGRQVDVMGDRVVVSLADGLQIYDRHGTLLRRLDAKGAGLVDVSLSDDGRLVASGGLDRRIRVWEVETGRLLAILPGHSDRVSAMEFGPKGAWLVSGSWDHTVRIWDIAGLETPVATLAAEIQETWGEESP